MSVTFVSRTRIWFLFLAILVSYGIIGGRLFYLHIFGSERYERVIERSRNNVEYSEACRGNIVDCKGQILATTETRVELGIDPQVFQEEDIKRLGELSELIGVDEEELRNAVADKYYRGQGKETQLRRWKKIADSLDEHVYEKVKKLEIKGVYGNRKYKRVYPMGALAAHVLGYVNKESQCVCGIERYMDFYLRGQRGWKETERDGRKRELAEYRAREVDPVDGIHVELTIDSVVQNVIEQELKRIEEELDPISAVIIVSEPATGYIMGLANYPSYDPNHYWDYPIEMQRNRAITDVFEPGSPFKIVTTAAVFNEKLADLEDEFDCTLAKVKYKGRMVSLPKDHRPFETLSVREIMKKSSNRGLAQMAMMLGDDKLYDYSRAFGFGERAGYGPGGEVRGTLHPVKNWDGLTIGRLPMGHAVDATALQLHGAMSVVANQGVLMQPQIVRRIYNEEGESVDEFLPKPKRRVISLDTALKVTHLLTEVVGPEGTSRRAQIDDFYVAGKSGTSQKIKDGQYSRHHHVGSFSGFLPADNPQFLVTVVINETRKGGVAYGGVVAAPAFKNIAEKLVRYLCIKPNDIRGNLVARKGE